MDKTDLSIENRMFLANDRTPSGPGDQMISELLFRNLISVTSEMDHEQVANIALQYNLNPIPFVAQWAD